MRIDTELPRVTVEIDEVEYALAERTVEICDKLVELEREYMGKPQYRLWLAELEVILGKQACRAIFPGGKKENVDRIQAIYYGVYQAFNHNADELQARDRDRRVEREMAMLGLANEVMKNARRVGATAAPAQGVKEIRRPE